MENTIYKRKYDRPYTNQCKNVEDGTVEKIKKLRDRGLTFGQISLKLGKSRQRVAQIYKKSIKNNNETGKEEI